MSLYHQQAAEFFRQYESIAAQDVHQNWLKLLEERPAGRALDIGAGSGRDARYLVTRGFAVTAVEPANALREQAMAYAQLQQIPDIFWLADLLPDLPKVQALAQRFDLILLSAVWMHLTPVARTQALPVLCTLMATNALLVLTLRYGSFSDGRQSYPLSSNDILQQLEQQQLPLEAIYISDLATDTLGRNDVAWQTVVLKKG